jgi:hypothetical protein
MGMVSRGCDEMAERVVDARCSESSERIEVGRSRRFERRFPSQLWRRAICGTVKDEHNRFVHASLHEKSSTASCTIPTPLPYRSETPSVREHSERQSM